MFARASQSPNLQFKFLYTFAMNHNVHVQQIAMRFVLHCDIDTISHTVWFLIYHGIQTRHLAVCGTGHR